MSDQSPDLETALAPDEMRDRLLRRHHAPLVCGPQTDIVIEGYPRSSNSFAIWMLHVLEGESFRLNIGHHTHDVDNLRLAEHFNVPSAVLIRAPEDAILSFMIYSDASVEAATTRYETFYEGTLALARMPMVLPFEMVTRDFNQVVDRINRLTGEDIPRSTDLEAHTARAYEMARERADDIHADKLVEQIAIPSAERETIKAAKRADVRAYLAERPEIRQLYADIMAQD